MTFEEIIPSGLATVLASFFTAAVSINIIFFNHLINAFKEFKTEFKTQINTTHQWLDTHETHDQNRHEENLHRFEKISVSLAKLGSHNGTK